MFTFAEVALGVITTQLVYFNIYSRLPHRVRKRKHRQPVAAIATTISNKNQTKIVYTTQLLAFISFYLLDFVRLDKACIVYLCIGDRERQCERSMPYDVCECARTSVCVCLCLCLDMYACVCVRKMPIRLSFSFMRHLESNRCVIYAYIYSSRSGRFDFFVWFLCAHNHTYMHAGTHGHCLTFDFVSLVFHSSNSFNKV